ncbi:hypothetical protein Lal_00014101 [Lupinus albus]|nr:hypothetical protein Lal_00014101 [Lupinus albus]
MESGCLENENMKVDNDVGSDENNGSLSPPSDNGGANVEAGESDDNGEQLQNDPYQEMPLHRCDRSLIYLTTSRYDMLPSSDPFKGESQSRKRKEKQDIITSSSNLAQSSSDLSIDETCYPHAYYIYT